MVSPARKRRIAVLLTLLAVLLLSRNKLNSIPPISSINTKLIRYTPWKILLAGYTIHYLLSHLLSIIGLGTSDLPQQHYHPDFVNLRKVLTGLDAGIVSCLHIRKPKWLRDTLSIILGAYFIIYSKNAENVMHRFHQQATIDGVRACWTKGRHPLLWTITKLKERLSFPIQIHRRKIIINPLKLLDIANNSENLRPIEVYLYFQGTERELALSRHAVVNYPGGGFVAMDHLHHESYVQKWCNYLRIPCISVNYRKAPEHPYPAGFNDAYYTYKCIVASNGKILGMNQSDADISIALAGDSAGGNFVAAVCCRAIVEGIKVPNGLLMAYPVLDLNMNLYRPVNDVVDFGRNSTNAITAYSALHDIDKGDVLKSREETPLRSYVESEEIDEILKSAGKELANSSASSVTRNGEYTAYNINNVEQNRGESLHALTSRIVYHNDAVLPIQYLLLLGEAYMPTNADPVNDMYLSPIRAPLHVLSQFPTTRIHVGSVDPLVDDSRRFAKILKYANEKMDVKLLEWDGISHAYIQCPTFLLPQARFSCELAIHWLSNMLDVDVVDRESFKYDYHEREKGLHDATDDFAFLRSRM